MTSPSKRPLLAWNHSRSLFALRSFRNRNSCGEKWPPPAFLVAAGLDPLYDDTFAYADALKAAGVPAETRSEPDLVHGFIRARHMSDPARESFKAISDAVKGFCHGGG